MPSLPEHATLLRAIRYVLARWAVLYRFLDEGRITRHQCRGPALTENSLLSFDS